MAEKSESSLQMSADDVNTLKEASMEMIMSYVDAINEGRDDERDPFEKSVLWMKNGSIVGDIGSPPPPAKPDLNTTLGQM